MEELEPSHTDSICVVPLKVQTPWKFLKGCCQSQILSIFYTKINWGILRRKCSLWLQTVEWTMLDLQDLQSKIQVLKMGE